MTSTEQSKNPYLASDEVCDANDESEISLLDIINFLQESWKKLLAASILGAVLGLSGWFFLGQYQAEYVLLNNNSFALDLVSWKTIQKSLL